MIMTTDQLNKIQTILNRDVASDGIIVGYGKPGHGMNGRDADLTNCGQCVVELITPCQMIDGTIQLVIGLRLYATICAPSGDNLDAYRDRIPILAAQDLAALGVDIDNDDELQRFLFKQAAGVISHLNTSLGYQYWFSWDGDGAWKSGINVTIVVTPDQGTMPLLASGTYIEKDLDRLRRRCADAISEANDPDQPSFSPALKDFEDAVRLCNTQINDLLYDNDDTSFVVSASCGGETLLLGPCRTRTEANEEIRKLLDSDDPIEYEVLDMVKPQPHVFREDLPGNPFAVLSN